MSDTFKKQRIALRNFLHGRNYFDALIALNIAEKYHNQPGQFRKDDVTPEFHHQVRIALAVTTKCDLIDPEGTIICALLHDTSEDYGVSNAEFVKTFGYERAWSIELTTKKFRGKVKDKLEFFRDLEGDCRASIVKGIDRYENINSMIGVFDLEKQTNYIAEGNNHFLPMLDAADSNFPQQHASYMGIRSQLKDQIILIASHIKIESEVIELRKKNYQQSLTISGLMDQLEVAQGELAAIEFKKTLAAR